jgi:hypothetical protein
MFNKNPTFWFLITNLVIIGSCVSDHEIHKITDDNRGWEDPPITDTAEPTPPITVNTDPVEPDPPPDPPPEEPPPEEPPTYPDIEVWPLTIDFGDLNADGEVGSQVVTVKNVGDAPLNILELRLDMGSAVYSLTPIGDSIIAPAGASNFIAIYDPATYETNLDSIIVISNDPDEPSVEIPVVGNGSAPIIDVYPPYYDFGTTSIGCDGYASISISNVGNVDLIVTDLDYFVTYPADLLIETNEDLYGPLPWTIPAGEARIVDVGHIPLDEMDDEGYLEIESNDPATPTARAEQEAIGAYSDWHDEIFIQEEISSADILFVVDNSGSMNTWQTALATNFSSFIGVFTISGVEYQIAVITTDDATFVGPVITPSTPDIISAFTTQAYVGTYGSAIEKGLHYAKECTSAGGDAAVGSTFTRTDAKLIIILVSDEDDHSTGMVSEYVTHFQSLKASDDLVTVHAVVGDSPGGCHRVGGSTWERADPAARYIEAAADMGGEFISICSEDWGAEMETLARDSILKRAFDLLADALEDTIEVEVDGAIVTDWTYNEEENAVYFEETSLPPAGSEISITYAVLAECL